MGGTLGPPVQGELQGVSHFASPSRVAELQGQIKNLSEEQKRALQEQIARKQRQVLHREKPSNIACPVLVVARCGGMYMLMMVVDDAKDGGAEKEIDPLDDSEGKESGQDFKSYAVKGIIDDVVGQTFSLLVELKHKLCQELLEETLEAVVMGHSLPKK